MNGESPEQPGPATPWDSGNDPSPLAPHLHSDWFPDPAVRRAAHERAS